MFFIGFLLFLVAAPRNAAPICVDFAENCTYWNEEYDICENIQDAKVICRKFCNLCSLVESNWADWSSWSSCDVTCSQGKHTRVRTCTNPAPAYRGLDCKGNSTDTKLCVKQLCPVHGGWTEWSKWGTCPVTCGMGIQKRQRTCTNPYPLRYGNHCFGDTMDVKICNTQVTCGSWSNWETWSSCNASCDGGTRTRSRSCTNTQLAPQGQQCVGDSIQVEDCNKNACHNYYCHYWTAEDRVAIGTGGDIEKERQQCESYLGFEFTQGRNANYPNCGTCYCCKPEAYKCYQWSEEELALVSNQSVELQKQQCESHRDFIFQGDRFTFKHCGSCWCCEPVYECYYWTAEDTQIIRAGKSQRARCEDDLGFIFTGGKNENFPGTGGCWCIKPKSE